MYGTVEWSFGCDKTRNKFLNCFSIFRFVANRAKNDCHHETKSFIYFWTLRYRSLALWPCLHQHELPWRLQENDERYDREAEEGKHKIVDISWRFNWSLSSRVGFVITNLNFRHAAQHSRDSWIQEGRLPCGDSRSSANRPRCLLLLQKLLRWRLENV